MNGPSGIEGAMFSLVLAGAEGRIAGAMARRASSLERDAEPFGADAGNDLRRSALELHQRASARVIDAAGGLIGVGLDIRG